VFNCEDDISVIGRSRWVNPTICFDNIAFSPHNMVALDVCNKVVQIHLVSAGRGHEGRATGNFAGVHGR
jgi:hypothetical protein